MIRARFVLAYIFAAACLVGASDQEVAAISHDIGMEAEKPVFESRADLVHLSMPCTHIKHARFDEPISAKNTRCTKADRSDK